MVGMAERLDQRRSPSDHSTDHRTTISTKPGSAPAGDDAGWWSDACERRTAGLLAQLLRQLPNLPGIAIATKFPSGGAAARTIIDFATSSDGG
jgi:hypothetical protein